MDCRERGSHARNVYPTQNISGLETLKINLLMYNVFNESEIVHLTDS